MVGVMLTGVLHLMPIVKAIGSPRPRHKQLRYLPFSSVPLGGLWVHARGVGLHSLLWQKGMDLRRGKTFLRTPQGDSQAEPTLACWGQNNTWGAGGTFWVADLACCLQAAPWDVGKSSVS